MIKVTMIIDTKIASPLSPHDFVLAYIYKQGITHDLIDMSIEQGDKFKLESNSVKEKI